MIAKEVVDLVEKMNYPEIVNTLSRALQRMLTIDGKKVVGVRVEKRYEHDEPVYDLEVDVTDDAYQVATVEFDPESGHEYVHVEPKFSRFLAPVLKKLKLGKSGWDGENREIWC